MSYTTTQLLTNAWYLSGVVSRDYESVSGGQLSDSLNWLNNLLSSKNIDGRQIPYMSEYDLTQTTGQELYFIPNLIEPETITFNQSTVRFATKRMGRKAYFGTPRVDGVQSLPFTVRGERTLGGCNLYFYYLPDSPYPVKIFGKFGLSSVTAYQDLSLILEQYYIDYLTFLMANRACLENTVQLPPDTKMALQKYESELEDVSAIDLTVTKQSTLQRQTGMNWAWVNFPGWTP